MGEEGKKFSFSFSKPKKPTNLVKPVVVEKKEVEYVDSFDGSKGKFSYKGSVREEPAKKELVIELQGTKTALEVIQARLKEKRGDIKQELPEINEEVQDTKLEPSEIKQEPLELKYVTDIKQEPPDTLINGATEPVETDEAENKQISIDDLAAKEIMEEIKGNHEKEETTNGMVISQDEEKPKFEGKSESTLEDYENVPITEYGLAMLRGMGWKPDKKKNPKDELELPVPRPKGLGLGADKVIPKPKEQNENLTIGDKSYVKFVTGPNTGRYGQVISFDGDRNRAYVKLALGGSTPEVSAVLLVPVTKKEYEEKSKVINSAKYERYKEISDKALAEMRSQATGKKSEDRASTSKKSDDRNSHRKEKYERSRRKRKSSESDDSDSEKHKKKQSRQKQESDDSDSENHRRKHKHKKRRHRSGDDSSHSDEEKDRKKKERREPDGSDPEKHKRKHKHKKHRSGDDSSLSDEEKSRKKKERRESDGSDSEKHKKKHKHGKHRNGNDSSFSDEEKDRKHKNKKNKKDKSRSSSRDRRHKKKKKKHSSDSETSPARRSRDHDSHKSKSSRR